MGRIMAIDYGMKRTGVAVSDPMRIIAGGLETVPTAQIMQWLEKYLASNDVDIVVVGRPVQMNGMPSETLPAIERFVASAAKKFPHVRFDWWDERFTSVLAQRAIIDSGVPRMKRREKGLVDKVSATIILQGYMEAAE